MTLILLIHADFFACYQIGRRFIETCYRLLFSAKISLIRFISVPFFYENPKFRSNQ